MIRLTTALRVIVAVYVSAVVTMFIGVGLATSMFAQDEGGPPPPPSPPTVKGNSPYSPPPVAIWTDCPIRVTHIMFDNVGEAHEASSDAMDLRHDKVAGKARDKGDLKHEGQGKGDGEWNAIKAYNEPALYAVGGENIKVRVRIELLLEDGDPKQTPWADTTLIWAEASTSYPTGVASPSEWPRLEPSSQDKRMTFNRSEEVAADGRRVQVSKGDGAGKLAKYAEFKFTGPLPPDINIHQVTFTWKYMRVKDFPAGIIHVPDELTLGQTQHEFYTVLRSPVGTSWYAQVDKAKYGEQHPTVKLLRFGIGKNPGTNLAGVTSEDEVLKRVTEYFHIPHGLKYDHWIGANVYWAPEGVMTVTRFHIEGYVDKVHTRTVVLVSEENIPGEGWKRTRAGESSVNFTSCFDQAMGALTLSTMFGSRATAHTLVEDRNESGQIIDRFGHINETLFSGGVTANNPFYRSRRQQQQVGQSSPFVSPIVDLAPYVGQNEETARRGMTNFDGHAWVERNDSSQNVYDALLKPWVGTEARASWLASARNTSSPLFPTSAWRWIEGGPYATLGTSAQAAQMAFPVMGEVMMSPDRGTFMRYAFDGGP